MCTLNICTCMYMYTYKDKYVCIYAHMWVHKYMCTYTFCRYKHFCNNRKSSAWPQLLGAHRGKHSGSSELSTPKALTSGFGSREGLP